MEVETYEDITLDEQGGTILNEEVSEEALAIIESLDLGGQRSLLVKKEVDDETTERRLPYRILTLEEARVFGALFPERTRLARYGASPIPLRVLQVAAHAAELDLVLTVWHTRVPAADPILIGERKNPERTWETERYLLARWGSALEPFDELRERAAKVLAANVRASLRVAQQQIESAIGVVDSYVTLHLQGENPNWPFVSIVLPS